MKVILILGFILILAKQGNCQNELIGNFNSCHSGRSVDLIYNHIFKKDFKFGLGILFNLNNLNMPDNQGNIYKKRLHAENFSQRFGLQVFFIQPIFKKLTDLQIDFFYNLQLKRATTQNRFFSPYLDQEINPYFLLVESNFSSDPYFWIQNTFGIGLEFKLFQQFYLNQKLGFGIELIHLRFPENYIQPKKWDWAFAKQFNVGLVYKLKK